MSTNVVHKEVMGQGWEMRPLGEVVRPARPRVKPSEKPNLPFIGMEHVEAHTMRLLGTVRAGTMKSSAVHFQPGDVLYGRLRPYLNKVYRPDFEGLCSAEFIVFPKADGVDSRYLQYFLNSSAFVSFASHLNTGDRPRVDFDQLAPYEFPVASIDQQKHIVAEIEKQFSRLDEAVANLKRVKANLKRYKAAVLKAAVEGRLVETEAELARREGRSFETGEQLLQRILETRRNQWQGKGKYKEPAAPDTTDLPKLPEGWVWTTLGQLVWSVKDGPHFSPKYSEEGIPFISGGNIRPEGIDFSSTKFISSELHDEFSKRCKPEYGDLLYTKGGTTGIARVNTETREFSVWVHVAVLKPLNSPHCYRQAQKLTHGVGNQDLGLTRMVWITVPLPSNPEQKRIIAEVDRRLSILRETESQVDANLQRVKHFRQSVLASAFSPPP
ncbi:restriction endonuclease subunit S [Nitrosomonas communis]|uniref:Type I restriction enzyme, S subunit n=1 Tax=Nitrosomonas communis TaxID=44574 RepID=A0A1I4PQR4_9PROT|nr:restriction endonuclease subunit S [Nitrosomonas communis]SFM30054.1 type I restriction enzyme, S subunit [Nitrosomonas communis]